MHDPKVLAYLRSAVVGALLLLSGSTQALDSGVVTPAVINPIDPNLVASCSYYFIDTFDGTVLPGGAGSSPAPTGTAITLKFYNNVWNSALQTSVSTPTTQSPVLTCAGTYQLVFMIELEANTNVATVVVTPLVTDVQGTTLYPAAFGAATTTLYPQCNNVSYAATPYCTVGWVTGSIQVTLPLNDQVLAPILSADSAVTVLGGQFELRYLHP